MSGHCRLTGGLRGPKLIIIAARPAVGKTAFMCNLVQNMAGNGTTCGVFELEMGRDELDDRWFAAMTGINSFKLTTGRGFTEDDWTKITDCAGRKSDWPVMVDDTGGLTIAQLKRRAKKMKRDGAEIIFIDQLSKIAGNRNLSSYERNTAHVEELGFVDADHLHIRLDSAQQLRRIGHRGGIDGPVVSRYENLGCMPGIHAGLEHLDRLSRDESPAQTTHELLALAREHAAGDDLEAARAALLNLGVGWHGTGDGIAP